MSDNHTQTANDPFTQFWGDMITRMGMPSGGEPGSESGGAGPMSPEAAKQMQRVFLDALAKYCDDFMRSEQFLAMMKEAMDRSLAFKQQVDQFLTQLHRGVQAPSKTDVDDISGLLRSIEANVLDRLERLESSVAAVEGPRRTGGRARASRAQPPSRHGGGPEGAKPRKASKARKATKKKQTRNR